MKNFICVLLATTTFFWAGNAVLADTTWTGTTGNLTDSTWSGGSSPFSQDVSGYLGVDYSKAYQGIYINSGTVTSSGTGFFLTSDGGSNPGDKPEYANRTVLRLTGGELLVNPNATQFTIHTGAGFIQTGGTLTMNTPNLTMNFMGSKVENRITNGTITVSKIQMKDDGKITFGGTAVVTASSGFADSTKSRFEVADNANVTLNYASHPNFSASGDGAGFYVTGGTLTFQTTANFEGYFNMSGGTMLFDGTGQAGGKNINVSNQKTTGNFNVSGGEITAENIRIGNVAGSVGVMNVSGGKITATQTGENDGNGFFVGNDGNGTLHMTAGEIDVKGRFYVGKAGTGTLTISGGSISAAKFFMGGSSTGVGHVTMSGGSINVTGTGMNVDTFILGNGSANENTFTQTGGTFSSVNFVNVGLNGGKGTLEISGGTFTTTDSMYVARTGTDSVGTLTLSEGTLSTGKNLVIGENGQGTFTQTGGTVKVGTVSTQYREFYVARQTGSTGTYHLEGGLLDVTTNGGSIYLARTSGSSDATGTATFVISGGEAKAVNLYASTGGEVRFLVNNGQFGTVTLTGKAELLGKKIVEISSSGIFTAADTSYELLKVGTASDLSGFTITNNSKIWNVSGNTTGSSALKIELNNVQENAYTMDSGFRGLGDSTSGAIEILPVGDPYVMALSVSNLTDAGGEAFALWLTENSDYTAEYLGDGWVQLGVFADLATYFAWDFTNYTAIEGLSLRGFSGSSVPEPAAWVLLVLGLLLGKRVVRSRGER
ncbi:MAG: hypothetical protein Q4D98_00905 [Planctomycetia bacterium]|nr:hypothetical protein [Planctomycetia bacterium]